MADYTIWGSFDGADIEYIRPYIEVNWAQNIGQNSSTVTASLIFERYTNNYWSYNELTNSNGHSCTFSIGSSSLTQIRPFNLQRENPPNSVLIWTRTRTIKHNADGTATVKISASGDTNVNPRNYNFSETVTLPTIPRETTINSVSIDGTLSPNTSQSITLSVDRKHSSYKMDYQIFAGSTRISNTTNQDVRTSLTFTNTMVNNIIDTMPTVTSRKLQLRVITRDSSGTKVGTTQTLDFSVSLNNENTRPTIPSTWLSRLGSGYDSTISKYVQNISRIRLQFAADYGRGATRQSQTIKINGTAYKGTMLSDGVTYRVDTDPLNLTGTVTIEYIATNSRKQESEPYVRTITFHAYRPPAIQEFTMVRSEVNPTNIIVSRRYTREYLDGDNTPTTGVIERQEFGSSTWQEVNNSNLLSLSTTLTGNSETKSYLFRTTITDRFGNSTTAETSVGTARVLMEKYKDEGISFGKRFETGRGTLQVMGDIYHVTDAGVPSSLTTPSVIRLDLQNGWTNYGWGPVGCYKVGGIVFLAGMVSHSSATGTHTIFTLPEGYRPESSTRIFMGMNNNTARRIDVTSGGTVRYNGPAANIGWVSLAGISFVTGES